MEKKKNTITQSLIQKYNKITDKSNQTKESLRLD